MANSKSDLVDMELKDQLNGNDGLSAPVAVESKKESTNKTTCWIFGVASALLVLGGVAALLYLILLDKIKIGQGHINGEEETCLLPIEAGDCNKHYQRWGYDTHVGTCARFTYGGCNGNNNNFLTKERCLRACAGPGGLPLACSTLHDKPLSNKDLSGIFGTSSILEEVAPPLHTGTLRNKGALPTGHFASNVIHNRPAPMRLIPYSAVTNEDGITYDAYTFERWNKTMRSDLFHQLTPGKADEPWVKLNSLGLGMKQMITGPDSNPFGKFTGLSGVQVGIANTEHPVMTSFEEMYANFLYTSSDGGTLELPLVRGAAMLTHIFTQADPILIPHCLVAVNGHDVKLGCPEEESGADTGSAFVEAYCSSVQETLYLTLHLTKPIDEVTDVQWGATRIDMWYTDAKMTTCETSICTLSDDRMMVEMAIPNNNGGNMVYSINVLDRYVIPGNDYYSYWKTNPLHVTCDNKTEAQLNIGTRMPSWFYGSARTSASCRGDILEINVTTTHVIGGLEEIQFLHGSKNEWHNNRIWTTCTLATCQISADGMRVTYTASISTNTPTYAVNVIGQYVVEPIPFNWKRAPYEIVCNDNDTTYQAPLNLSGKSFIFELAEPLELPYIHTRKFVAFFSEEMTMVINDDRAYFASTNSSGNFTGIMQLAYAGTGEKGDFEAVNMLENYTGTYAYKPKTRTCVLDDTGYISWDWNTQVFDYFDTDREPQILMVALHHHEVLLEQDALISTPFGFKGYTSDIWVMEEPLVRAEMEPESEAIKRIKDDPAKLRDILNAIEKDAANHTLDQDCTREGAQSYWAGKSVGMISRLASISRAFGTDHYTKLDDSLRKCLDLWLGIVNGITEANLFRYDTVWGGMFLSSNSSGEIMYWTNFGFVSYSNHHIHLGYWIYAISYYAKHHNEWTTTNDTYERIMALVRDVASPSKNDTFFPTVRHKDWYMGHSWATGIGGGIRQTESTSEAINCYHAVAALGHALGDETMQNIGRLMLATEIRSTREYWHVRAHNRHIFPPIIQTFGVLGQMQEDGIFYYTLSWPCSPDQFPETHACIVGIQIIPITSVSRHYIDEEWARNVEDVCSWAIDPTTAPDARHVDLSLYTLEPVMTQYAVFCYALTSQIDKESKLNAAKYIKSLETNQLKAGTGFASTLLFIYEST